MLERYLFTKAFNTVIHTCNAHRSFNVTHTALELKDIIQLRATVVRWTVIGAICRSKQLFYWDIALVLYKNIM